MKTIRMPRKMGEITERLPKPQYDAPTPTIKRTNSMPSGLAEADAQARGEKSRTEQRKPEFVRPANGSLDPMTSHKSHNSLLELPHKAIIRTNAVTEDKASMSRALMEKAHEIHNKNSQSEKKMSSGPTTSIANRA